MTTNGFENGWCKKKGFRFFILVLLTSIIFISFSTSVNAGTPRVQVESSYYKEVNLGGSSQIDVTISEISGNDWVKDATVTINVHPPDGIYFQKTEQTISRIDKSSSAHLTFPMEVMDDALSGNRVLEVTVKYYEMDLFNINRLGPYTTTYSGNFVVTNPYGTINVNSNPSDANIYLDGTFKGTTPFAISEIPIGSHTVKVTKSGYADASKRVSVSSGSKTTITVPLTKQSGTISISSNQTDAKVYLDDTYQGIAPLILDSVPLGTHTIKVMKTGYTTGSKTVTVTPSSITKITASLPKKIQATPKVTPKIPPKDTISQSDMFASLGIIIIFGILILGFISIKERKKPKSKTFGNNIVRTNEQTKSLSPYWNSYPKPPQQIESVGAEESKRHHTVESKSTRQKPAENPTSGYFKKIFGKSQYPEQTNRNIRKHEIRSKSSTTPTITSAFGYKGATIQYKIKIENPTSEPIADIKINLYVPDVFLVSESTKSIAMLKPSESKTVTFEIRPTGECGDCEVSGKVVYYDYSTKKTTGIDIPPKSLSIVCPMLKGKEIDESEWHSIVSNLIETEESTREIDMPAETLFTIASRIVKDMHMHRLEPEITDSQQLFNGVARFYGEGIKGMKYAAQVEVVGGAKKSRLILKTWAEKEEALTGFYHGLLDEIEKRVQVKGYIDDSIVQNFYHYGDKIGTQVKDSIVQRSNIGAGGDVDADTGAGGNVAEKKCPTCGTVAEGNGKYCNECGGKLEI